MQCILREKLINHALKLSGISDIYRNESHRFVESYLKWLEDAEKDLSSLRSPLCIILSAEKSTLTSVVDGYSPEKIQQGKSARKTQKAVAAQSLEKVAGEIYTIIGNIDQNFEQLNEKLCHAVAVLVTKFPDLLTGVKPDITGTTTVWRKLGALTETIPVYNYFSAKLPKADINYLLTDIIQNMINNRAITLTTTRLRGNDLIQK